MHKIKLIVLVCCWSVNCATRTVVSFVRIFLALALAFVLLFLFRIRVLGLLLGIPEWVLLRIAELLQDAVVEEIVQHLFKDNEAVTELIRVPGVALLDVLVVHHDCALERAFDLDHCEAERDVLLQLLRDVIGLVNLRT